MKPRFVIVTLVMFALAVPALMLAQQNSKGEKEISALLEEIRQVNLKGGPEAVAFLDKYNADDVVRIPGIGLLNNKADILNGFKTGTLKVESLEYSDIKIRMYGNWAVVTAIESGKGTYLGTPWTGTYRFSRVFVKRDGIWKTVLYQDTPIAGAANAQTSNNVPPSYVADPAVYTLIIENDQFRVIIAKKPVGHRDAWHSHLPAAVYDLTDCDHRIYTPDGKTIEIRQQAGRAYLQQAIPSHSTENIGTAECDQLIVERK